MKKDIVLSGVIAVAVHILVLSGPLPRGSNTDGYLYEPVSVSIIHHQKPVAHPPASQARAETGLKPYFLPKSNEAPRQNLIPKTRPSYIKRVMAEPLSAQTNAEANRPEKIAKPSAEAILKKRADMVGEVFVGHSPKVAHEKMEKGASIITASIAKHRAKGDGSAQGTITYAIPKYKDNPLPYYPKIARRRGYEGRTLLRVEVLESGEVGKMEIAASSGFEVLDSAALKAVRGWTFVPGTKNEDKTRQWVMVPIRFSLK
jgi:TonB family protein